MALAHEMPYGITTSWLLIYFCHLTQLCQHKWIFTLFQWASLKKVHIQIIPFYGFQFLAGITDCGHAKENIPSGSRGSLCQTKNKYLLWHDILKCLKAINSSNKNGKSKSCYWFSELRSGNLDNKWDEWIWKLSK